MVDLAVGDAYETSRTFTREDVERFTEFSRDAGEHHVEPDDDGRLLVHGLLTATLVTELGGSLDVLASRMDYEFPRPVYTGERIECTMRIVELTEQPDRVDLVAAATCTNEADEEVLRATVEGIVRT